MKKGFAMTLALLLVAVGACFVSMTYARYTENISREGTASVAKWAFTEDNPAGNLTIKLDETYDATSLVSGKIAPGTSGSFDIELSNATTETAIDVTVAMEKQNIPTNLKFYTDEGCTEELTTDELTAVIAAKGSLDKKTIYWKWAYNTTADETIDGQDTANGKASEENRTMSVKLTITGTQQAPSTTAVTSAWN